MVFFQSNLNNTIIIITAINHGYTTRFHIHKIILNAPVKKKILINNRITNNNAFQLISKKKN